MKNRFEMCRMEIQHSLDDSKTALERNERGQFATPKNLADSIVLAAISLLPHQAKIRFLEPAIGTGSFFSALLDNLVFERIDCARGYEIDEHYALPAMKVWEHSILNYVVGDFLEVKPPSSEKDKFNLIVSNPPYVRHHHLKNGLKDKLYELVRTSFGLNFSKLSGLYCYFLSLTSMWLQKDGISVWLIPGEFLDVNYGVQVKKFLLSHVKLLRIHRFNPESVQFSDALVTSVVVFYTTGMTYEPVLFSSGEDINNPSITNFIDINKLNPSEKWSTWFVSTESKEKPEQVVGDYFYVKRGLATGSNKHFILTKKQIVDLEIPKSYYRSILPSPRYVEKNVIEQKPDGSLIGIKELYLLDITCGDNEVINLPKKLQEYLESVKVDLGDSYLVSKRKPWYRQENRPQCPFLLTYMGRNTEEPFRLLLNLSTATASNGYLMLYPKFDWETIEQIHPGFLRKLHAELLNIKGSTFTGSGRVYGGGLFKMEPKELMNTPIDGILSYEMLQMINIGLEKTEQLTFFETTSSHPLL